MLTLGSICVDQERSILSDDLVTFDIDCCRICEGATPEERMLMM